LSPSTLYVTGNNGVYKSVDGGASWTAANGGIAGRFPTLAVSPADSTVLYAGSDGLGLFRSATGGL
jgi:hypothetical protein